MISRNLLNGNIVLLAASLVNTGPCRPVSSSTAISSISETTTSSFENETATQTAFTSEESTTASIYATSTETGTTVTVELTPVASSIDTSTIALIDTTTSEAVITATAESSTTTEAPEALQLVYFYVRGSNDPSLAHLEGTGFVGLKETQLQVQNTSPLLPTLPRVKSSPI
ncbi:hypothetical protein IL306_010476 [Fusarium sp. DS 682]|nr:hypothetical protein IL306_010476 [Fusarium sp. DS 682]